MSVTRTITIQNMETGEVARHDVHLEQTVKNLMSDVGFAGSTLVHGDQALGLDETFDSSSSPLWQDEAAGDLQPYRLGLSE